jgi:hypothetical protein
MTRHRLVTLYGNEGAVSHEWPLAVGEPAWRVFELSGLEMSFRRAEDQMPRLLNSVQHEPSTLELAPESDPRGPRGDYTWTNVNTYVFLLPYGAIVLGLAIEFEAEDVTGCIQILRDTSFRKRKIKLGGKPLREIVVAQRKPDLDSYEVGRVHQLFVDDDVSFFQLTEEQVRQPQGAYADLELNRINMLMNHDLDPYREDNSRVRFPQEANQSPRFFTALTPGTTVLAGHSWDIVNGMLLAAVQCVASTDRAAWIRAQAYSSLRGSGLFENDATASNRPADRQRLAILSRSLGRLELELSFGVDAYLDVGLVLPDERIAAYQRALARDMALPEGVTVIEGMLERLSKAISAAHAEVEKNEREADQQRSATWGWVTSLVAAVTIPVTLALGFLGVNAKEISGSRSILDPSYIPYYVGLLLILIVGAGIGWFVARRNGR